jgi:hypothetical protein
LNQSIALIKGKFDSDFQTDLYFFTRKIISRDFLTKNQQCHIFWILEMHAHLPTEMPHFLREMRHLLWEMCISQGDDTAPMVDEHISWMWVSRSHGRCGISTERYGCISKI